MTIALVAHDSKKELMVQFCTAYRHILAQHHLIATGTTGRLVEENVGLPVQKFLPGGHGGGQQVMARIACEEVDMLLFFRDPIAAKPSEPNEMNCCASAMCTTSPWPPTSPPPRSSSTAWSTATSTGAPSCTRRMRKSQ